MTTSLPTAFTVLFLHDQELDKSLKTMLTTNTRQKPNYHVLIVAAGHGSRFAAGIPKQYCNLMGKPILTHTIETFVKHEKISSINCVINQDHEEMYYQAVKPFGTAISFTFGGATRSESVKNGLKFLGHLADDDIILVHDAARPLLNNNDLNNIIDALTLNRAASLASPITNTLRHALDDNTCGDIIPRDHLWAIQTPQGFRYGDLCRAHDTTDANATDDTSLMSAIGIDVTLIPGAPSNVKITTQEDFIMAQQLMTAIFQIRTGLGFDVHAFDTEKSGSTRLGGIDIDHDHPLKGHSDADVALHTITDAILGAIGEGDIGIHFPPSDNSFKNMDSAIFLKHAVKLLQDKGGFINNIDLTIICEKPKIGPHAQKMRQRIAEILSIDENAINVKATTTEKLGFTGRGEGIAAQAIATVSLPL